MLFILWGRRNWDVSRGGPRPRYCPCDASHPVSVMYVGIRGAGLARDEGQVTRVAAGLQTHGGDCTCNYAIYTFRTVPYANHSRSAAASRASDHTHLLVVEAAPRAHHTPLHPVLQPRQLRRVVGVGVVVIVDTVLGSGFGVTSRLEFPTVVLGVPPHGDDVVRGVWCFR